MEPPTEFEFPFTPYDTQKDFMRNLYQAIEGRKLGIFESPTGTGKSMSLICGALRWLRDHEEREMSEAELLVQQSRGSAGGELPRGSGSSCGGLDSWVFEQAADRGRKLKLAAALHRLEKIRKSRARVVLHSQQEDTQKESLSSADAQNQESVGDNLDANELVEANDHETDEEESDDGSDEEDAYHHTQIIYASRTHSQLAQFAGELRRAPLAGDSVRCITLASRLQLCTLPAVRRLAHLSLVNQACLDLQKTGATLRQQRDRDSSSANKRRKVTKTCPYKHKINNLANQFLSEVHDVEQLVSRARSASSCAYYASRRAVSSARILLLPYTVLLHARTRRAAGVRVGAHSVLIIDEAHNLLETVYAVHASRLTRASAAAALSQLRHYQNRYRARFSPRTVLLLRHLASALAGVVRVFATVANNSNNNSSDQNGSTGKNGSSSSTVGKKEGGCVSDVLSVQQFLERAGVDNINLMEPVRFAEKSRLAQKLRSCWNGRRADGSISAPPRVPVPGAPLPAATVATAGLSSFLSGLTARSNTADADISTVNQQTSAAASSDDQQRDDAELHMLPCLQFLSTIVEAETAARLLISVSDSDSSETYVKFLPLDVASRFKDIVEQARCVILAGGTMQPVSEFIDQLFIACGQSPDRVSVFSCGHVIPPDQLLPLTLTHGPAGGQLQFTYQHRSTPKLLDEVGRLLLNYCRIIPGGVVCFLPSYDLMQTVFSYLTKTKIIEKLTSRKMVFCEPRQSSATDSVLQQYTRAVKHGASNNNNNNKSMTGAVLFSVVGGKMSEGINFNDDLGRCVIVVGMPYPNVNSPELKEKMRYLDANNTPVPDGRTPGQVLYENLCMKAVNQSIGRAIRHRNDYACVVLCDSRYSRAQTLRALPEWVGRRISVCDKFGSSYAAIKKFFNEMNDKVFE